MTMASLKRYFSKVSSKEVFEEFPEGADEEKGDGSIFRKTIPSNLTDHRQVTFSHRPASGALGRYGSASSP